MTKRRGRHIEKPFERQFENDFEGRKTSRLFRAQAGHLAAVVRSLRGVLLASPGWAAVATVLLQTLKSFASGSEAEGNAKVLAGATKHFDLNRSLLYYWK